MSNQRLVLVLTGLSEEVIQRMHQVAEGFCVLRTGRQEAAYEQLLPKAEAVIGGLPVDDIPRARSLRWLQIGSAGANRHVDALPPHVKLTNASGVFGVPMAEHVLAMMLALTRQIPEAVRAAGEARWRQEVERMELFGATCGIVGLGDVGTEVARRAKALGMRVLAVRRRATEKPPFVDELYDVSGLDGLLAASDHVVDTLPGTVHTRHLIDARRVGLIKRGAYFYNVGRGSTVDEAALTEALRSGQLAGAGLDVFETEPLAAKSPLWKLPNVIVTPHRSAGSARYMERLSEIVLDNLQRYAAGRPLRNVVDREWGY